MRVAMIVALAALAACGVDEPAPACAANETPSAIDTCTRWWGPDVLTLSCEPGLTDVEIMTWANASTTAQRTCMRYYANNAGVTCCWLPSGG